MLRCLGGGVVREGRGGYSVCLEDRDEVLFGQIETQGFERDFKLVVVDVVVLV